MNGVLDEFSKIGIIPVVAIDDVNDAEALAEALINGGLPCAEVTFRTDAAEEAIRRMTGRFPRMLVGAGTVLTTTQAKAAVNAGAKFIVSPGLNPKVVTYCIEHNIPVLPGCANPSDIELAIELGLDVVKFFPAEANGGLAAIKAMSAPYGKLKFMPTGGISPENVKRYLAFPKVIACGGSWMAGSDLIKAKDWDGIMAKTKEAVSVMLGLTIKHVGINMEREEDAMAAAPKFAALFGEEVKKRENAVFAGSSIELMKKQGRGKHGHIAIGANQVERAVYHLQKKGFSFDADSMVYDAHGNLKLIYFADEIAGFALHLQKN